MKDFNALAPITDQPDNMYYRKNEWDQSYINGDNFIFYPHEEVIRFVSKYIKKRVGPSHFLDQLYAKQLSEKFAIPQFRILDLGCGIGRHVKFCTEMQLDSYGVDLSETAIETAHNWLSNAGLSDLRNRLIVGNVSSLPWTDSFFHFAVSHGVLDSMPWQISRSAIIELSRTMVIGGLFYCDLILEIIPLIRVSLVVKKLFRQSMKIILSSHTLICRVLID